MFDVSLSMSVLYRVSAWRNTKITRNSDSGIGKKVVILQIERWG